MGLRAGADVRRGWVAPHVAGELPGLGIAWVEADVPKGKSPEGVREQLRYLADRIHGADALQMRERPVPWAYRVLFRQIGIDPDVVRTPAEALALLRLHDGGFKSRGRLADALTIGIADTGVALRAFDTAALTGELGIREAAPGESFPPGSLVVADERAPLAALFGGEEDVPDTARAAIVAVHPGGVPEMTVAEALHAAASSLR